MLQQVITLIILAIVAGITIRSVYRKLRKPAGSDPCNGCGDGCDGCAVMEIKKELSKRQAAVETQNTLASGDKPTDARSGRVD
jgi:hypothetical protein